MKFYSTTPYQQTQKSQNLRLVDVFLLGPLMITAASKLPPANPNLHATLVLAGALTIAYNGGNYLSNIKG